MGQVFLSYAREDRLFAGKLARVLSEAGHDVWWDRRLSSGEEFSDEIEAALNQAEVVLVAWSVESVKSRWVRDEAAAGGDTGRLVPVSIDGSLPPMGFRQFHSMDLSGWKGGKRDERTSELIHSVARRLDSRRTHEGAAPPAPQSPRPVPASRTARTRWIVGATVLLVAVSAAVWFWTLRPLQSAAPTKPTIGLLTFTTTSADPQLRQVASEARDSLSNTLSQSGIPVKMLGSAPQGSDAVSDYLISGDFSRSGNEVVGTLHLDEVAHGVTLPSYRFEAAGDDVRNLPERIGVQMAANLSWSGPLMILDKRHPHDPTLIAALMQDNYLNDFLPRYQTAKRLAASAPELREAQVSVAYYTPFILAQLPTDQRAAAIADARHAFDKARELDPRLGDVYGSWCFLHSETLFRECEDHLRAGIALSPDDNWLNEFHAALLEEVGRFDDGQQLQQLSYTHDPYSPIKIRHALQMLEYAGATDEAEELNRNAARWWPEFRQAFLRNRFMGLLYRGDFDGIARLARAPDAKDFPALQASATIISAVDSRSIPGLRRACAAALTAPDSAPPLLTVQCFVAVNKLGDVDDAFVLADKLYPQRVGRSPAETEQIWLKEPDGGAPLQLVTSATAAPMRRDPRFLALAQRTGLLDYWRSGRPPDFCRPPHLEPLCGQLLKRS